MADITIQASMVSDIPEQAAKSGAALKAMATDTKTAAAGASTSTTALGKSIDDVGTKSEKVANGGMNHATRKMREMTEQGKKLKESMSGVGESVRDRLQYPVQQLTFALEAGVVAIVAYGLATYSSLQQSNLQLTAFAGNAIAGTNAYKALLALRDPASMAGLSGSYETLVNGGMSSAAALKATKALAGAGAVSGNSDALMASTSAALADISSTGGKMSAGDLQAIQKAFPTAFALLGKDTGQSAATVRTGAARGQSWQMPANFLAQLEATSQATGGKAAYDKTFKGMVEGAKTSVGDLLAVVETPLAGALSKAAGRLDTWAGQTEGRFSKMSGRLASDLKSGNIAGFSTTLAAVLGDPKLAGGIETVTKDLEDLAHIFTGSIIPALESAGKMALPVLKTLSDILDVMAAHKTATKDIILAIGGFIILSKVAQWGQAASLGIKAFQEALEAEGLLGALTKFAAGVLGLKNAEGGTGIASMLTGKGGKGAATAAGEAAEGGALGAEAGGMSAMVAGLSEIIIPLAIAAVAAYGIDQFLKTSAGKKTTQFLDHNPTGKRVDKAFHPSDAKPLPGKGESLTHTAMRDAFGSWVADNTTNAKLAALPGKAGRGIVNGVEDLGSDIGGLFGHHKKATTASGVTVGTVNISLPGAGDPEKVANAIPKAINAQVSAYNTMTARRTGKTS